jgi:hypothetical protein
MSRTLLAMPTRGRRGDMTGLGTTWTAIRRTRWRGCCRSNSRYGPLRASRCGILEAVTPFDELPEAELDLMEERATNARPGPWQAFIEDRDHTAGDTIIRIGGLDMSMPDMYIHYSLPGPTTVPVPDADLDFIANARQDIPRLVTEVRRLRGLLSDLQPRDV